MIHISEDLREQVILVLLGVEQVTNHESNLSLKTLKPFTMTLNTTDKSEYRLYFEKIFDIW